MAEPLHTLTALGHRVPQVHETGPFRIAERFDVALASLAIRAGREAEMRAAAKTAGVPLPDPARARPGDPFGAFWVAPGMWFVEAPFATHEDIVAELKAAFGSSASITEQTDAWVRFDLKSSDLAPWLERLSNVDWPAAPDGFATRTVIEHLGCYLIRRSVGEAALYGPRSSAISLLHALDVAAKSPG